MRRPPMNLGPILRSVKPRSLVSDDDKADIHEALAKFRGSFLNGAIFSLVRDANVMFCEGQPPLVNTSIFVHDAVITGLQLSLFPLVNNVAYTLIKPEIKTWKQWVPWTVGTSVVTSVILRTIRQPMRNCYATGKPSMKGFLDHLPMQVANNAGFQVGSGLAQFYLPPPDAMGGTFARDVATLAIAEGGGTLCMTPFLGAGIGHAVRTFASGVPLIMFDEALFSITRHCCKRYLRIPG